ncbi:MAG: AAA family ATPase [Oscillospiraceae bacterium]|nr:AAA family ATPase [Oscillospiraceae bacterium]
MQFRQIDATFGKLERRTLRFEPGLNVIEAPNESGKSTLAAFLRTMLYGLPTRERGSLAEKNLYAPWSGGRMQGRLALSDTVFGDITLQRDSPRINSPMSRFSATYTGTGEAVAALTASDCGETLLGVPREVYERSAFIRQSGLAIDQNTELERRIAALITTGEEGASYSEANAALKKQLNLRRSNSRNGQIPTLEREIEAAQGDLAELQRLMRERAEAENELSALQDEEKAARADLEKHALADRQARAEEKAEAERTWNEADAKTEILYRMIHDANTPAREELEQQRAKLRALDDLSAQQREAVERHDAAEDALRAFDDTHSADVRVAHVPVYYISIALCLLAGFVLLWLHRTIPAVACFCAVLLPLILYLLARSRAQRTAQEIARRRGELETAVQEAAAAKAVLDAAYATQSAAILSRLGAEDLAHASAYIDENLARYQMLAQFEREAREKQLRFELLDREKDDSPVPSEPIARPERSAAELRSLLERLTPRREELQRRMDYRDGRIRAIGEASELIASLERKRAARDELQAEYDSIQLAMDALERANATLQNRFSPELGERAAAYFAALTGGKYETVLLDRTFHASTSEVGEGVAHDAAYLSQGAFDQLYLAVRLAICDMVLPQEKSIPLVLDDALINFDDARCANALEVLLRIAQHRQILLLTCQHREAAYLTGRDGVHLLSL